MKNNELHFISRLSTYTFKTTLIRVLLVSFVGAFFLFLAENVTTEIDVNVPSYVYAQAIAVFVVLTEANVLFDNLSERFFPIPSKIKIRVFIHFCLSFAIGFLHYYISIILVFLKIFLSKELCGLWWYWD